MGETIGPDAGLSERITYDATVADRIKWETSVVEDEDKQVLEITYTLTFPRLTSREEALKALRAGMQKYLDRGEP